MSKLILIGALIVGAWKLLTGRWPWEPKINTRTQAVSRARKLLGVGAFADRAEIIEAHKRLVTIVHPDRGGSSASVHEATAARDLLLAELPHHPEDHR